MPAVLRIKDDCPELIASRTEDAINVLRDFYSLFGEDVQEAARLLALAFSGERRVFCCGSGQSEAIASLLAGHFLSPDNDLSPLPAVLLARAPAGTLRRSPDQAFAIQLEACASDGDVLALFSADGNDPEVVAAARCGREQGMFVLGITGGDGGQLAGEDLLDLELRVPSIEENIVHEVHAGIAFTLGEMTHYYLYTKPEVLNEVLQEGVSSLRDELSGE